jgi:hypothetical protein
VCLNCGAALSGPFCAQCGQRAIPAYPTMRELVGDAWHEWSGYDGRVVRTFLTLLRAPGALTVEALEGHRARYVSPVRLYLVASLVYFLLAAASPNLDVRTRDPGPESNVTIDLRNPEAALARLPPEKRAEISQAVERTVWWMRPIARAALLDPAGFQRRLTENLPRTFFVLVPAFAAIVALFYRRRPFAQHLIFALHLHAAVFLLQAVHEAIEHTRSIRVAAVAAVILFTLTAAYALVAFRRVYRESWPRIVAKSAAIAVVYAIVGVVAVLGTIAIVSLT